MRPGRPTPMADLFGAATHMSVPALLDELAERVADLVVERLPAEGPAPWLDVDAAAKYLCCPRSRIYDLVQLGRLRPHRDGRRLLFRHADLDAALEA